MNVFNRQAALRISAVSAVLAALAGTAAWFVARERAEESVSLLAMEESRRLLRFADAVALSGPDAKRHAEHAASLITGGLFDIAEIYDRNGTRLAESMTPDGAEIEKLLPAHVPMVSLASSYESIELSRNRWVLRVFVPLLDTPKNSDRAMPSGFFEGVRVVPEWQRREMRSTALIAAMLASLASFLCGAAIYPVVVRLSADNAAKARDVLVSHISTMEALGRAIAKRDADTGMHNYRVAWIATRIGESLGLKAAALQGLIVGSFLHDIGKIAIRDAVLLKPGKLDEAELVAMRTHVAQGEEMLAGISGLDGASDVVSGHHERWDGTGYPRGLSGPAIPLTARIFAVADVFDALCSQRPYKEAMPFDDAISIVEKGAGSHFDPAIIAAFRPIARAMFDELATCDESQAQALLEQVVKRHFGLVNTGIPWRSLKVAAFRRLPE